MIRHVSPQAFLHCLFLLGPHDHPFLKAHAGMGALSLEDGMGGNTGQVARRTTEEEDMAYFEKRYQARVRPLNH